ncbi:MAG: OmpA family protein [Deltaproteobacteria bacterium]|nr:OmpA family protein [Deltaproteobacteria bacterium]
MSTVEHIAEAEDDNSAWLIVFLNLLLVVLAMFIALVSMMHFEKKDKKAKAVVVPAEKKKDDAQALREKLKKDLEAAGLKEADVDLHRGQPRIILPANVFFRSGKAKLARQAEQQLSHVASTLKKTNKRILVEGHTDDRPIHTRRFPSNWELSAARALAVVQLFIVAGVSEERLEIAGYGEFQPRTPNTSPENRRRNRRIEIKLR